MSEDEFCPTCDVTMDFHDDVDDCEAAEMRAERLESMERMFFGAFL